MKNLSALNAEYYLPLLDNRHGANPHLRMPCPEIPPLADREPEAGESETGVGVQDALCTIPRGKQRVCFQIHDFPVNATEVPGDGVLTESHDLLLFLKREGEPFVRSFADPRTMLLRIDQKPAALRDPFPSNLAWVVHQRLEWKLESNEGGRNFLVRRLVDCVSALREPPVQLFTGAV